jgi:tRNA-dihydrouridine synthase A
MIKPEEKTAAKSGDRSHYLCVAPMMDWTDRHCRYFHRLLAPHARLYTEMVTTGALIHGDRPRHLDFSPAEHPIALQLGGSEPADLAACAAIGTDWGYDEINLNCGCPSDRVQAGRFGACLMNEPKLVAECVAAMKSATEIPITIKCRIGVDDSAELEFLNDFVQTVSGAGCDTFIIHARKAWLKGLSPKENREIPPLRYDIAAQIKKLYPHLKIILNGGLTTREQIAHVLPEFDGVMLGREAYSNPYALSDFEELLFGTTPPSRAHVAEQMAEYFAMRHQTDPTLPLHAVTRHMLGLYHGCPRARTWRRMLTEGAQESGADQTLIQTTCDMMRPPQ